MQGLRISAVVDGEIKHLCQCRTYKCQAVQERDPRTQEPVNGRWLMSNAWSIHRKADRRVASLQTRISLASDADQAVFLPQAGSLIPSERGEHGTFRLRIASLYGS